MFGETPPRPLMISVSYVRAFNLNRMFLCLSESGGACKLSQFLSNVSRMTHDGRSCAGSTTSVNSHFYYNFYVLFSVLFLKVWYNVQIQI